jgi:hypothetical protein
MTTPELHLSQGRRMDDKRKARLNKIYTENDSINVGSLDNKNNDIINLVGRKSANLYPVAKNEKSSKLTNLIARTETLRN